MQHYTTVEQSKKLVELGLNPLTSDMYYSFMGEHIRDAKDEDFSISVGLAFAIKGNHFSFKYGYVIPCWSLGALLELMPKFREYSNDGGCYPVLCKGFDNNQWHCVYRSSIHITNWYDNSIDAAFEMVVWLLENNYIKKGE